ncbi:MAG: pirin family protein [Betaproteobacteria bacterium]|nr:pirin family protein [Betaproteobacteria bacterium]
MAIRRLQQVIQSVPTSDGAGVKLRRSIGSQRGLYVDPFLMLDEFSTDNPHDYIAGFPPHPHRGFETVTYMLDGHLLHEDHLGNKGDLKSGGAQWMTAGRGIIHSEMPQQTEGRMRGFQLWINLPAAEKMKPAWYRDIEPHEIAQVQLAHGGTAKVIAGTLDVAGVKTDGPITGRSTEPLYLDVELPPGATFRHAITGDYNAFIYLYEGALTIGAANEARLLKTQCAGVLSHGDEIAATAQGGAARFLLLAGKPIQEPVVQYGPFVMNTREEVEQAVHDYQNGVLAA